MQRAAKAGGIVTLLWSACVALGLLGLLGLSGCSHDLDGLFCDPDCPDACDECSEPACEQELANCREDDACTEQLACTAKCNDPGCLEECRGLAGMQGYSPFLEDLWVCRARECHDECRVGQKWECTNQYEWPKNQGETIEQRVRFGMRAPQLSGGNDRFPNIPLAGATVRVEGGKSDVLDAANAALLELPTITPDGTFRGFFEVESDDVGIVGTHLRAYFPPLSRVGLHELGLIPDLFTFLAVGWLPSPELAALYVYLSDCTLFWGGVPVRFRVDAYPDAEVAYYTTTGTLSASAEVTTRGVAFFPWLEVHPPDFMDSEPVTVEAFLVGDDGEEQLVAKREVSLRKGWTTVVSLVPLALRE